jgi:hypothetical protein
MVVIANILFAIAQPITGVLVVPMVLMAKQRKRFAKIWAAF